MNIIKSIQQFYTKYNSHMAFVFGTISSSSVLLYMVNDCHKYEINKIKQSHNNEIQKLHNDLLNAKKFNYSNDKSNVF